MQPSEEDLSFIADLQALAASGHRGAMARLSGVLRGHSRPNLHGLRLLGAWGRGEWETELRPRLIVATLFALHPKSVGRGNFGYTLRRVQAVKRQYEESLEKRFMALLNCHVDDLENHLRRAVSLAHSADVPVNWARLLADIRAWDRPNRPAQESWAASFWRCQLSPPGLSQESESGPGDAVGIDILGRVSSNAR